MRHAVFTFGRFNPPTIGHQKLVEYMRQVATDARADLYLFVSPKQDSHRNPLTHAERKYYLRKAFDTQVGPECKSFAEAFEYLHKMGYQRLTCVVGSDRVASMLSLKKHYDQFCTVTILEVPRAAGSVSASYVREVAVKGSSTMFTMLLPVNLTKEAANMYQLVRERLGVKEMAESLRPFASFLKEEDDKPGKADKTKKDPKKDKSKKQDPDQDGDKFDKDTGEEDEAFDPEDPEGDGKVDGLGRKIPEHLKDPGPPDPSEYAQAKVVINPPINVDRDKLTDKVDEDAEEGDKPHGDDKDGDKKDKFGGDGDDDQADSDDAESDSDSSEEVDDEKDSAKKDKKKGKDKKDTKKKIRISFSEMLER